MTTPPPPKYPVKSSFTQRWLWPLTSLTSLLALGGLTWHTQQIRTSLELESKKLEQNIQQQDRVWTDQLSLIRQAQQTLSDDLKQLGDQQQQLSQSLESRSKQPQTNTALQPAFMQSLYTNQALISYHFFNTQQYSQALAWLEKLQTSLQKPSETTIHWPAISALVQTLQQQLVALTQISHAPQLHALLKLQQALSSAPLWANEHTEILKNTTGDAPPIASSSADASTQHSETAMPQKTFLSKAYSLELIAHLSERLTQLWTATQSFLFKDIIVEKTNEKQRTLNRQEQAMQRAWMINLATQATIAQQNHQSQAASQSLDLLSDTLKTRTVSSDEQRRILLLIHQCREALVHDTKALRQDYQRLFQHLSAAAGVEKIASSN